MKNPKSRELGMMLRSRRVELGFSVNQLAMAAGVPASTVLRFERGEFAAPSPGKLATFADLLGMSLADVFAKAGYVVTDQLPTFGVYLNSKYPGLSKEAVETLSQQFSILTGPQTIEGREVQSSEEKNYDTGYENAAA